MNPIRKKISRIGDRLSSFADTNFELRLFNLEQEDTIGSEVVTIGKLFDRLAIYDHQLIMLINKRSKLSVGVVDYSSSTERRGKVEVFCKELYTFDEKDRPSDFTNKFLTVNCSNTHISKMASPNKDTLVIGDERVTEALISERFYIGTSFLQDPNTSKLDHRASREDLVGIAFAISQDNFLKRSRRG